MYFSHRNITGVFDGRKYNISNSVKSLDLSHNQITEIKNISDFVGGTEFKL